ncbi:hypothetical protein F362_gp16 [Enterobacter phage EcP1]|uniref:Lipoprotein n=1 Tax=Enterobacter phage EcP1 TaxID=942016 RepID=E9NIE1_9CAUD|nr:hypothetical protein F362_gp16 [Enterobacter phage EcP1]ADU79167.1 hypothetical protein EcP1_gp16 [Enterobacter phage EcP1]
MIKSIILMLAAILLVGCSELKEGDALNIFHDNNRYVTCYVYKSGYAGGISCIPDDQLPDPESCVPGTKNKSENSEFPDSCVSFKNKYTDFY